MKASVITFSNRQCQVGNLVFRTDRLSIDRQLGVMGFLGEDENEVRLLGDGPEEMLVLCNDEGATIDVLCSPKLRGILPDELLFSGGSFNKDGSRRSEGWRVALSDAGIDFHVSGKGAFA